MNKPLHVCIIGPAGSVHTQRWVGGLRERGLRVTLLSPGPLPAPLPPALRDLSILAFPVGRAGMSRRARLVSLLRGWALVPRRLKRLNPDIAHIHSLPLPAAVPFLLRVPRLVVSAWGSDVVLRDRRKAVWYPLLLNHAAAITATSHHLAQVVHGYMQRPRTITVIAFGVDTEYFAPEPRSLHAGVVVGYLKRLEAIAGPDLLLAAFAQLQPDTDGVPPRLHFGGGGSQQAALQREAARLGVAERVVFHGDIAQADAPAFLRGLDIFAMPSRADAFGVAAVEAQSCGLPVVASRVGGVPEVVRADETGLLVPPDDVPALRVALQRLVDNAALRERLGAAGPPWVKRRYAWQQNLDEMLAVYQRVASSGS